MTFALQIIGFALGVALFGAIVIGVKTLDWRLRGRPPCDFKWPRNWRNLIDDGWRSYPMVVDGKKHKGWYRERPYWIPEEEWDK